MRYFRQLSRFLGLPLCFVFIFATFASSPGFAGMVSTDQVVKQETDKDSRDRVSKFLEREDVRKQLRQLGVDPKEAAERVNSLSDAEVAQIVGKLDTLPAGQSALGAVLGAVIIVFLVLLVTDILGLTNIFPFVRR